jgi:hypothetical protein
MAVHRVLALLLISALIATTGVVSSLHTHAYDDHDHPEHHHGPAAHEHHAVPAHPDDGIPHLEGCDPGKHAVPFAFVCAAPPQVHAVDAVISLPASPTPELQIEVPPLPRKPRHAPPQPFPPPDHVTGAPPVVRQFE